MWPYDFGDFEQDDDPLDADELMQEILRAYDSLPIERPIHSDKQVLSFEDLEIGKHYLQHETENNFESVIQIVSEPYLFDTEWRIDYALYSEFLSQFSGSDVWLTSQFLTDMGVKPYFNGGWNTNNWLEALED